VSNRSLAAIPVLALVLLGGYAARAHAAGGMNLSWSDCGTAGQLQRNFACNTNAGFNTIVASVIAPAAMGQFNGQASSLELETNQASLSNWWQLASGGCRPTALTSDFNFTSASSCADPWQGGAFGGVNYTPAYNGPNRARIRTICAIPGSTSIDGTSEYYLFKVSISNAKSVGGCGGCTDGVVIVYRSVWLTQPAGVGDYTMVDQPIGRHYVKWQPGAPAGPEDVPLPTPARNTTWGGVKSLYR